jgi:uncharacterized protein GlcG (DUF336 family)
VLTSGHPELCQKNFTTQHTLALANQMIACAFGQSRKMRLKPTSVVALDNAGHVKAMQREDGASMFRIDAATGKAWGAVGMGMSSRGLCEYAEDNPNFFCHWPPPRALSFYPSQVRY